MAEITKYVSIKFETVLRLDERETRALEAMTGYGIDPFLKVFYEKLGKCYMQPWEPGLRSLFEKVNSAVHPAIGEIDRTRKAIAASEALRNIPIK